MKTQFRLLTITSILLFALSSCGGPKPTWTYLIWGSQLQSLGSDFPIQYAEYIERDQRVIVEIKDYATGSPLDALLTRLNSNLEFVDLVANAEVMTFDWNPSSTDSAERKFLRGECGGSDNQDCLRATYQQAKQDWIAILDRIIELRGGDSSRMRQIIMGSWPYPLHYSNLTPEQLSVLVSHFLDMASFLMEEAGKREIEYVKVFPDEYFDEKSPPEEWVHGVGLTEKGDKVIVDALKEFEFEKPNK